MVLPLASGCGQKNPVEEISTTASGIGITERAVPLSGTDWPAWRGPHGNGTAPDQELPTVWSEDSGLIWRADVPGRGHGSPIVVGDSVFLATALATEQKQKIVGYDRTTGQTTWTTTIHDEGLPPARSVHQKGTHANATLACDRERLYAAFLNSDSIIVSAVDLSGDIIWQVEAGKFVSRFGYAPSPVLYKSLVIVAADNSGGGYVAALDGESGRIAWRIARGNIDSYSSPTVTTVGGRDQLLISGCHAVTSYDPATGNTLWTTQCISEATCGTIVTTDNLIFASGGYPDKETICLSADGERIWSNKTKIYEPSLSVIRDQLIGVTDGGVAHCWNTKTGELAWRQRLSGNFSASPLVCGDRIYVPNLSGETFVFTTIDDEYNLIARNKLGDDCYASPAAADGRLFLRIGVGNGADRKEQLVCIGK
jgi:outer membrane protein assembly factor BamB